MFNKDRLLLPENEIATDAECDLVLKAIYECNRTLRYLNVPAIQVELANVGVNYTLDKIIAATSILYVENFIKPHNAQSQGGPTTLWEITFQGVGFINSDTYVRRGKRWKIENGMKTFAYRTRWIVFLTSIAAIIISIIALVKPNDSKPLLLIPTQKWLQEQKVIDTVYIRDTVFSQHAKVK